MGKRERRNRRANRKRKDPEEEKREQDRLDEKEKPEEAGTPEAETPKEAEEDEWLDEEEPEEDEWLDDEEEPEEDEWLDDEEEPEEDEWLDDEEEPEEDGKPEAEKPEESEEDEWLDDEEEPEEDGKPEAQKPEEAEEDEWLDDEEEPEEDGKPEAQKPEEAEEDEWLDDEEEPEEDGKPEAQKPEEAEEDEWLDDEEEPEEDEWLDDEESEEEEWLDEEEPESGDEEEDNLTDIVAAGMREEPTDNAAETSEDTPSGEASEGAPSGEAAPPPAGEGDLNWDDWFDADAEEAEEEAEGKKHHRRGWIAAIIIVAAIVAAYLCFGFYFRSHFLPNTYISGINCSYKTEEEVADAIQAQIDQYELWLEERNDEEEALYGKDFDLHVVRDNSLAEILEEQGVFQWPRAFFEKSTYNPGRTMEWDEEKLTAAIDALNCMDESQMIDPEDATVVYDEESEKFVVQPAIYGTHIKSEVFTDVIEKAVASLAEHVNLEEAGCYETPNVTEESPQMIAACEKMNVMLSADITYDMIDVENIHISKDQIKGWILLGEDLEPTYNEEAIRSFIAEIADQYDTRGKPHSLHTSWDTTVTVDSGTYGWELDQEGEYEQLTADLAAGETVTREPVWAHTANSHGENDYGNTYVEVNLTKQHLYFYKGGTLIIDSDFVSGRMTTSRVTHEGIYFVYYKQSPAVLKGADYETPVTFWMPFNGGEGLHDATWRGSFGGTIYMSGGSHGCVNLPYSTAETIYNNINVGDCVFVYWENGLTTSLVRDN